MKLIELFPLNSCLLIKLQIYPRGQMEINMRLSKIKVIVHQMVNSVGIKKLQMVQNYIFQVKLRKNVPKMSKSLDGWDKLKKLTICSCLQ